MRRTRGRILTVIGFACFTMTHAAMVHAQEKPSAKVLRAFSVAPEVSMRVYVPAGRVRIVTWSRDSVQITGSVGAASSMFGGGDRDHVKFGVDPIRTGDVALASADLLVMVPRKARLWVKMTSGVIDVDGSEGELELYAVGGSISVRNTRGVVSIESIDAVVTVDASSGDLRVRGSKAPITLRNVTGTSTVTTVSGIVSVLGAAPECRIETIGGDIAFDASALRGATVELQTHGGAIGIDVNAAALPILDVSSRTGRVQRPDIRGSLKHGRIVARSFKGAITVRAVKSARMVDTPIR